MKKNILILFALMFTLLFGLKTNDVKAVMQYEDLTNSSGKVVYYKGTNTPIKIPTTYTEKDTEFRGTWVSFFAGDLGHYSNKNQMINQLNDILDTLDYYNINSIIFHVRTHNDAYYKTDLAPINSAVSGCDFDEWDYLEWFIDECHARGIEFHAWLNPYRISSSSITQQEILDKYADCEKNPAHDIKNVLISSTGKGAILNPAIPEVRDYIVDVCMELIENYDIDAIHFDDYFYIEGVKDDAYNTNNLSLGTFRRNQIDLFIEQLSNTMYQYNIKNNRAVQLGVSPTGIYKNGSYVAENKYVYDANGNLTSPLYSATSGYEHYGSPLYCDTKKWVDNEWIDYIIPQNYQSLDNSSASHAAVSDWWNMVVANKDCRLYMGLGTYKMSDSNEGSWYTNKEEMLMQLRYNQDKENIDGICIYQYKTLVRNISSVSLKKMVEEYWTKDVFNPVVKKYEKNFDGNIKIDNLKLYESDNAYALSWDKNNDARRYAVYKTVNNSSELLGFVGNGSNDFVSFTDLNKNSNASYKIVPITKANSFGVEKTISTNNISKLEYSIGAMDINVSEPDKLGASFMVIFSKPEVYFGDDGKYQIFVKLGDDGEWQEEVSAKDFSTTNSNRLTFNKYGIKMFIKVVWTNNMGKYESEVFEISFKDNLDTIMDYIISRNDELFEDILGL